MAIVITAPPPGSPIGPFDDVVMTVSANGPALKRAVLTFELPGLGRSEQVHDGTAFVAPYQGSLRTSYTNGMFTGFEYRVRRDRGWPDGPICHCVAFDTAGGEAIL